MKYNYNEIAKLCGADLDGDYIYARKITPTFADICKVCEAFAKMIRRKHHG